MPASLVTELVGEFIFKPLLEGAWHLTGRGVLGCVLGERLVVVPDEPEAPPRNWKSRKKWVQRQQATEQLPSHLRPAQMSFSAVTGIGLLAWLAIIGVVVLLVWLI